MPSGKCECWTKSGVDNLKKWLGKKSRWKTERMQGLRLLTLTFQNWESRTKTASSSLIFCFLYFLSLTYFSFLFNTDQFIWSSAAGSTFCGWPFFSVMLDLLQSLCPFGAELVELLLFSGSRLCGQPKTERRKSTQVILTIHNFIQRTQLRPKWHTTQSSWGSRDKCLAQGHLYNAQELLLHSNSQS